MSCYTNGIKCHSLPPSRCCTSTWCTIAYRLQILILQLLYKNKTGFQDRLSERGTISFNHVRIATNKTSINLHLTGKSRLILNFIDSSQYNNIAYAPSLFKICLLRHVHRSNRIAYCKISPQPIQDMGRDLIWVWGKKPRQVPTSRFSLYATLRNTAICSQGERKVNIKQTQRSQRFVVDRNVKRNETQNFELVQKNCESRKAPRGLRSLAETCKHMPQPSAHLACCCGSLRTVTISLRTSLTFFAMIFARSALKFRKWNRTQWVAMTRMRMFIANFCSGSQRCENVRWVPGFIDSLPQSWVLCMSSWH